MRRPGRDPGLAHERTHLAWNRTGWSMAAAALAVLRQVGRTERPALMAAAGALLCASASSWYLASRLMNIPDSQPAHDRALVRATISTVALAACGLALAFV